MVFCFVFIIRVIKFFSYNDKLGNRIVNYWFFKKEVIKEIRNNI